MSVPRLSFEFFPPKNDVQQRRFWRSFGALEQLRPDFVSVTWGALGADSAPSLALLSALTSETSVPVMAHLACAGMSAAEAELALDRLHEMGVRRLLALRGDNPATPINETGVLSHATDLLRLAAARGDFDVCVAAYPEVHPESATRADDIKWLKRKAELGANGAITQFFFDTDAFLRWRDDVSELAPSLTLIPGILPIDDINKVCRFAEACGASVPRELRLGFARLDTAVEREALSVEIAVGIIERLQAEGLEQFHLYTLNRSALTLDIAASLGIVGVNGSLAA